MLSSLRRRKRSNKQEDSSNTFPPSPPPPVIVKVKARGPKKAPEEVVGEKPEEPLRMNTPIPTESQDVLQQDQSKEPVAVKPTELEIKASFDKTVAVCNEMKKLVAKLRNAVNGSHRHLLQNLNNPDSALIEITDCERFLTILEPGMVALRALDENVEMLPESLPMVPKMSHMQLFDQEVNDQQKAHQIDLMLDKSNWKETQQQNLFYFERFLQCRKTDTSKIMYWTLPPPIFAKPSGNEQHQYFLNILTEMQKEMQAKSLDIIITLLYNTPNCSFVEFKFFFGKKHTENYGFHFKFLLVEKNGKIDYVSMRMPTENWAPANTFYHSKIINPGANSRYLVYQRMTIHANLILYECFGSVTQWKLENLFQLISLLNKFREVFKAKCRACNQHLKRMMPPVQMKARAPGVYFHENCRF